MSNQDLEPGRILIFRNKGKPEMRIAAELQKFVQSGHLQLLAADDPVALRKKLEDRSIRAVVIDIGREIGDTMAVLRMMKGFPDLPLFIFNGFMLPRVEEKIWKYERCHYTESLDELDEFIRSILNALTEKKQGSIPGISLSGLLQLMLSEKWNGQVKVVARDSQGLLFLSEGRLIGASAAERNGHDAWLEMSSWQGITVETSARQFTLDMPRVQRPANGEIIKKSPVSGPGAIVHQAGAGTIDFLHLVQQNKKFALNLKELNRAVAVVRDILSSTLLRTDIFLTKDGRSLAGWNSNPLACSHFAAITRSLSDSLHRSGFPSLGAYYLLELNDDQLLFIVVKNELQWGFLLKGLKNRLGLLMNIVLPKALLTLEKSIIVKNTA